MFVRREESTRGHVLVVMLAYLIVRWLQKAWADIDLTVEEALDHLKKLSAVEVSVKGGDACLRLPEPLVPKTNGEGRNSFAESPASKQGKCKHAEKAALTKENVLILIVKYLQKSPFSERNIRFRRKRGNTILIS